MTHSLPAEDPVVIVGYSIRVPGAEQGVDAFEKMLFQGRDCIREVPDSRFNRSLYYDAHRSVVGKAYTVLGGCVDPASLTPSIDRRIADIGQYDLSHKHFAEVAANAWESLQREGRTAIARRCGVFVGHSGGTEKGGDLILATLAESVAEHVRSTDAWNAITPSEQDAIVQRLTESIRRGRPRSDRGRPHFQAYSAASLVCRLLGLVGPRGLVDGACASSLLALQQAMLALQAQQIDAAIVGGATFNSVDNLILFSQSQACSSDGSTPFDATASGLISSEGYVAVVVTRRSIAEAYGLEVHGVVREVGVSTDGRGKSLWAPRTEGQQLAILRAYPDETPLSVDYQEAHATSTQLGDATELQSLAEVMASGGRQRTLQIGSVKSNLGHTLEAAGLVGLVKVLIALRRSCIPASVRVRTLTPHFDWSKHRITLTAKNQPWPKGDIPRRAAVNAFGIGGINAHAVIEEPAPLLLADDSLPRSSASVDARMLAHRPKYSGALAIVGRGVVLAGASNLRGLTSLLNGQASALAPPPPTRWIHRIGVDSSGPPSVFRTPTNVGGYIVDYSFDGRPYRIPPKQIERANPAQMMLLDAVDQACREAALDRPSDADRKRIGVVIGSVFGGEFSNHLQIGLRLPEIGEHLRQALKHSQTPAEQHEALVSQLSACLLGRYPALLDETGSFTASTLASRIAKTFDWMGGACAVDGDDASGALAIWAAAQWLRGGQVDAVACGVAQRSLDLVAFEQLDLQNRLVRSGRPEDIPADCSQILPGEGVAAIVLKRLEDAQNDGSHILGVIDDIDFKVNDAGDRRHSTALDHQIISRLGYLIGGHSMIRLICETLGWERQRPSITTISASSEDDFTFNLHVRSPELPRPVRPAVESSLSCEPHGNTNANNLSPLSQSIDMTSTTDAIPMSGSKLATIDSPAAASVALRIEASSATEFEARLQRAFESPGEFCSAVRFQGDSIYRAAVCGKTQAELLAGLEEIRKAWQSNLRIKAFPKHRALLFDRSSGGDRIAWLFPGQGSQYPAQPQVIAEDTQASEFLATFDEELVRQGSTAISHKLSDPDRQLGKHIWWTQAWVLAVTAALGDALRRRCHCPDVVLGHSFGEWSAALHAGVLSMRQAIQFAKVRSEAVATTVRQSGRLLSVRATPSDMRAALAKAELGCEITHYNSRDQVVIAGTAEEIQAADKALGEAGFASLVIPVPAAFHTPAMIDAQQLLASAFARETLRPPRCGFLSATTATYLGEPSRIGDVLIGQLTRPVLYEPAVTRLIADGCGLLLEVGPSDVLTRLSDSAAANRALCIATDGRQGSHSERMQWIDIAVQCVTDRTAAWSHGSVSSAPAALLSDRFAQESSGAIVGNSAEDVEVIDVTSRSRRGGRPSQSEVVGGRGSMSVSPIHRDIADTTPMANVADRPSMHQPIHPPTSNGHAAASDALNSAALHCSDRPIEAHREKLNVEELATSIESIMIDFVIDQTGYSPDLIDLDADLESELAIDSIKKAQLLGELQEQFDLHDVELGRLSLSDFTNLRSILDFVVANLTGEMSPSPTVDDGAAATVANVDEGQQAPGWTDDFDSGLQVGSQKKNLIRDRLRSQIDRLQTEDEGWLEALAEQAGRPGATPRWTAGVAAGAGVMSASLLRSHSHRGEWEAMDGAPPAAARAAVEPATYSAAESASPKLELPNLELPTAALDSRVPQVVTSRFSLATASRPWRAKTPTVPLFAGDALVIGSNRYADAIVRKFELLGVSCHRIDAATIDDVDQQLDELWQHAETPHLFLATPHDVDSLQDLNSDAWAKRRSRAIAVPYRICQRWMQRMIDGDRMQQASLVSLTRGCGFGFSQADELSPESGGIAGLTKAMLIEAWMRGYRDTPMKVIEPADHCGADEFVDAMLHEMAVPSYDLEVAIGPSTRKAVRAYFAPLKETSKTGQILAPSDRDQAVRDRVSRGGVWVVSGGGRGISAFVSLALAEKYGLKLVLLGTTELMELPPAFRERASADRSAVRREHMKLAQERGDNPVEAWRTMEKVIEIDATMREARRRGIEVMYRCVDVADTAAVAKVINEVRSEWGPVTGVLHGAGAGQDARFDRKRPSKVERCIRAKVDGCISLYEATKHDPLEWFIGFGSISGRFGANGHTDYSLANDMLAKCIDRIGADRPEVRCVTFHWHAWGDIGMAAKPEAKLALEMIGIRFMPAAEGLEHFLQEIECGGDATEVLITDRNYVRKFFPEHGCGQVGPRWAPLLKVSGPIDDSSLQQAMDEKAFYVTLDPETDRFLAEHRIGGRPTLPMVVALELMAEAAQATRPGQRVVACTDVVAHQALRFASSDATAIKIASEAKTRSSNRWTIQADVRRRDGRLVQEGRTYFEASFETAPQSDPPRVLARPDESLWDFRPIVYPDIDAPMYHGESLRALRQIAIDGDQALGHIASPSLGHLGGEHRPLCGWVLPAAAFDAVLFTTAILAFQWMQRLSLPVSFQHVEIGRLPDPGEPLWSFVRVTSSDQHGMTADAELGGINNDCILKISGYRLHWVNG